MEKSIETIWKDGFLKDDALLAPKLNNLYKKKSIHLIDKIKRVSKIDNLSILPIALVFGVILSYLGFVIIGFYGASLMILLFSLNKKLLKSLDEITINTTNYQYLIAYKKAINTIISFTTKIIGFGLPLAVIPAYWLFFKDTEIYQKLFSETSNLSIVLFTAIFGLLLSSIGILIYKLSTKILYGYLLVKLDEMIADMEELKNYKV